MAKGTIARIMDRGFGFIKTDEGGGDLFFHRNELEGVEFNNLREGQEVEFEKGQGRDGRPAATKVRLAGMGGDDSASDDSASEDSAGDDSASDDGDSSGDDDEGGDD